MGNYPNTEGGPAFPITVKQGEGVISRGMTLRDYFAGQALAGINPREITMSYEELAQDAYRKADAMLAEREKQNT